jgi:hypothetical protein
MPDTTTAIVVNLTDNPEVRSTEAGIARAMFRVAVSGPAGAGPSFFTVIVWRDQVEDVAESLVKGSRALVKGSRVGVVGRLQRSWTRKDGRAFYQTRLMCVCVCHQGRQCQLRGRAGGGRCCPEATPLRAPSPGGTMRFRTGERWARLTRCYSAAHEPAWLRCSTGRRDVSRALTSRSNERKLPS